MLESNVIQSKEGVVSKTKLVIFHLSAPKGKYMDTVIYLKRKPLVKMSALTLLSNMLNTGTNYSIRQNKLVLCNFTTIVQ